VRAISDSISQAGIPGAVFEPADDFLDERRGRHKTFPRAVSVCSGHCSIRAAAGPVQERLFYSMNADNMEFFTASLNRQLQHIDADYPGADDLQRAF
jgi:hypothetical protein